jgi:filamentous hemagglutinin family protein
MSSLLKRYHLWFFLAASSLFSLPEKTEVIAGTAHFSNKNHSLQVTTSDKAIINYESFTIGKGEQVEFMQPSKKSTVLNRVIGGDPSDILGKLFSNGQLFLVNPNGIYFGPDAVVNAASFLASTLQIKDEDFLAENYQFYQEEGKEYASVVNEAHLLAGKEGFIALLAPVIQNRGSIYAKAGKVALAAAEHVTLDFTGDGLIRFSVEGELEKALIENYGKIEAIGGNVELKLGRARDAMRMVVNTDGIQPANQIEKSNGVIRLVCQSDIRAEKVHVEGEGQSTLDISGVIDVSEKAEGKRGGAVHILGEEILLSNGRVNASGNAGGGEILIGGEYQGSGSLRTALFTTIKEDVSIYADAEKIGDGGKVIIWADDTTLFDGKVFARGGEISGNGGFVETSGKNELGIAKGFVNTAAAKGLYGDWLLDPNNITIVTGGNANLSQVTPPNCGTAGNRSIAPATIAGSLTNVTLCAQRNAGSSITVTNAVTMNNNGVSLTLTAGSGNAGPINLNNNLTTRGGNLIINGVVALGANVILDTTNSGGNPAGGNISFSNTINGANSLNLAGGTDGAITMTGAVGNTTPLTSLTATGATINQNSSARATGSISYTGSSSITINGNVTTSAALIQMAGPVSVTGSRIFDSTNAGGSPAGANISFSSTLNGGGTLSFRAGTGGNVSFTGAVGGTIAPANLTFTSANLIQIGGNIHVSGANPLTFPFPVSMTGNSTITSNNAAVNFNSTINGANSLSVAGGTGAITFTGAVGATTPLISLNAAGSTITQNSTVQTVAGVSYSGSSAINVTNNITTSGGNISFTGPLIVSGNPIIDTTNGGATPTGGDITATGTINGASTLALNGGTAGAVIMSGAIGNSTALSSLTVTGLSITQGSSARAAGVISYMASSGIGINGNITTSGNTITISGPCTISGNPTIDSTNGGSIATGADITFSNTINGATALTLRAGTSGTLFLNGAIGGVTPLTNLSFTSANLIQLASNVTVTGANPLSFPFPVTLTGISNITSNNANISFSSTINGDVALSRTLRLIAGTGNISLTSAIGGTASLSTLAITSAANVTASTITTGALSQSAGSGTSTFNGAISTSNILGVNLTGTAFTFNNTVTTTNDGGVSINNSSILSMPSGSNFTVDGAFSQTGSGVVRMGNTLTSNNSISFTGPIALTDATSISTAAASQTITFASTIDSISTTPFDLTLDAGTSNITVQGDIGSIQPLGTFLVNTTNNLTIEGITATGATLNGGTGTTIVNGDVQMGAGGITLNGNNFVNNGNVLVTDGGSVVINNSGTATRAPGKTVTVSGDFSVIGTGPAFGGATLTVGGDILFNPPVTLVSTAVMDTSGGNGNITFSDTVNGTQNLSLITGSGTVLFSGEVGGVTPLGNITINSAGNVTTQAITASSFRQLSGTGTTTLSGAINTSGALGVAVNSSVITRGAAITTSGGGPITITNSGLFTSTAAGDITSDGAFTQNGTGGVSFGGSIITSNDNISFSSQINLAANGIFNTGTGSGNITFSQGAQNAFALTLNSGSGNITLGGDVGTSGTPLTGFTITRAADVSTQGIYSPFIIQSAGSGTTTFNGTLSTSAASGITLNGTSFTFNNPFTVGGLGALTVTNTGVLTFNAGATGSIAGSLTQSGGGSSLLSSSITAGGSIDFIGAVSLSGSASLDTSSANQPITFFSTIDGSGNLTLSTGTEDILFSSNVGGSSAIGNLVIASAQNVTSEAITAGSISQLSGTGTTLFQGVLTTSGAAGINLTGAAITFLENVTASGSGAITITNSSLLTTSASKTLLGAAGFTQNGAGNVNLAGNISASDADITFSSPITLISNVILNSGTTSGDITVDTVDGNFNLTFTAGRDITAGVIGGTTRVGTITATTVRNNNASSITAASIIQLAGTGTTSLNGNINTNTPAGINLVGTNFSRSGSIITTNGGSFSVSNSGSITGTSINTTSIDGSYTQTAIGGSSSFDLAGTITARLGISLSSPITLRSDAMNLTPVVLDSSGGNGDITITGAIDNDGLAAHTLTLRSGSGDITMSGNIGSTTPIGPLILGNANNFTSAAISAASIQQEVSTTFAGIATFNDTVSTTGSSGIVLSGNVFTFNDVTTGNTGPVEITNSGLLTLANGSQLTLDGAFTQNGAGDVSLGGTIATTEDAISFFSAILLTNPASLQTGAGVGNITLAGAIDGAFTLELLAGTGNINLQDTVGQITPIGGLTVQSANNIQLDSDAIHAGPFSIVSATGTTTFNGILEATTISIDGTVININNTFSSTTGAIGITNSGTLTIASLSPITAATSFTQMGAGTASTGSNISSTGLLSISSALTMTSNIILSSGGGNITLGGDVDGVFDLTLTAGSGDITLSGNVGVSRIGSFIITSANDISVNAVTASSISLQNGAGTATLSGNLDTNTINGIQLIGNAFTSSGTITTTNGGPLIITNSGLVTATGVSSVTLNGGGAFTQNGTGPVNIGGTLTTQNANISYTGPVSVQVPVTLTSNNGNITFFSTVDGPSCPTIDAGTGDVIFEGILGGTTPLGCLDATADHIFINESVETTGAVDLTASSSVNIGSDITATNSNITISGPVLIGSSLTISSGLGAGNISISDNINPMGGQSLTITAGTGDVTLSSTLGDTSSFTNVTISGENVSVANFGSVVPSISGILNVTATTDLTLTGTTYNNGEQNYTAGNNFNFTALSPVTVSSHSNPITFSNGTIQLASNLIVNSFGGDITLSPLLGTGVDLTVNADIGDITFVQIGAMGDNLNDVTFTSTNTTPTPVLNSNVFANSLTTNSSTPQVISTNQLFGTVTFNQPVIIQGNIFYTCGSTGTLTFNDRVDANTAGSDSLSFSLNPCGGSVVFNGPVGSVAPLSSLSFDTTVNVTANNVINVGNFSVANGSGATSLNAGITSTASGGIDISSASITLSGSISTANGGDLVLDNSGALTISVGSSLDLSGDFQQTGAGACSLGGNITTHDGIISFAGDLTLTGEVTLQSVDASGANISSLGTIDGSFPLTTSAGSGDISFNDVIGGVTPLTTFRITGANNITTTDISASSIELVDATGTASFGALTTTGLNGVNLTGNTFSFSSDVTTSNNGPLLIDNSGFITFSSATYSIAGALTQNGPGSITLGGNFTVGGTVSFAQDITLTDPTSFNTSANGTNITFGGNITNDAGTANALTLVAGSGDILCSGDIGATSIGAFTITSARNATFGAISASSLTQSAGTGSTSITGNITTTDVAGIDLTGVNFTINSTITTSNAGPVSISHTGLLSLTAGSSSTISGTFTESGLAGLVSLSGTIATNNQAISFANPITLIGNTTLSSGIGGGAITLSSTVDGNNNLSLEAGTSSITLGGNIGDTNAIGAFTVSSVNSITYPSVRASSIVQTANSGTTTITGPLQTTGITGVSITGGVINQNGTITTFNEGPVSFINSGTLTVANGINTVTSGGYTQSGGGSVSLGGSISSQNDPVSFADPIALTADISITSGPITANTHNLTFSSAITGAQALSVTAMGGSIIFGADVGTNLTPLTSLTITNAAEVSTQNIFVGTLSQLVGTGTTTFNGTIDASSLSGIALTGSDFVFNDTISSSGPFTLTNSGTATFNVGATASITGAFLQNGIGDTVLSSAITAGGTVEIQGSVNLSGTASIDTSAANQSITFFSSVDGSGDLTLSTGLADIEFAAAVGQNTRVGDLTISTVANFTTEELTAASFTQSAGSGLSLFQGALDTNGASGISLTGTQFTFSNSVTTTGGGPITITNSGALITTIGQTISSDGIFTQNGSGNVTLASNIQTTNATALNAAINFTGSSPITLSAPVSIDSSTGGGDITFGASSTVNGGFAFTIIAGSGDIDILGDFGGSTRLGALTVTSVNDFQAQAITAASITQSAGSGTSSLLGSINTNTPSGMTFIGNNFTTGPMAAAITTTNGGSLTFVNQGLVSGNAPVAINIDGAFVQSGPGIIFIQDTTARLGFSFTGPTILAVGATLNSSGGNGNMTFNNIVSGLAGTEDLVLNAGSGNITFSDTIGETTTVGAFNVMELGSVTCTGETISVNDIGSSGIIGVTNAISLTATGEIDFTGTTYNANSQTYDSALQFCMTSGSTTSFTSNGNSITFQNSDIELSTGTDLSIITDGVDFSLPTIRAQDGNGRTLTLDTGVGSITLAFIGSEDNGEFASASFTSTNLTTTGDLYADAFTLNYSGTCNAGGNIIASDNALSFPSSVVLDATNIFSTVGSTGAGISFAGTVNGAANDLYGLTLITGSGDIIFNQNVGNTGRLSSLVITSVRDLTLVAPATMSVDGLIQQNGSGTTALNGALTVPGVLGIQLTGTRFALNSSVITLNNASMTVNNSDRLTVAGTVNLSGSFSQTTSTGPVTLSGSITANQPISFAGPITLSGVPSLDTSGGNQTIQFSNTLSGTGDLMLTAGTGNISLAANVGSSSSSVGALTITSCNDILAQSVFSQSLDLQGSDGLARVNGHLSTTGAAGVSLVGTNFLLNGALTTTNGGSVTVTNSGLISGLASSSRIVDGSYTQNGTGSVNFAGSLTTLNGPISFSSAITCLGGSVFDASNTGQNITFSSTIDGPAALTVLAGSGDVTFSDLIGGSVALSNVTISSANDVNLSGVGTSASGVDGSLAVTASNNINLSSDTYTATIQRYAASNATNMNAGSQTTFTSQGDIIFPTGSVTLANGSDLLVLTNDGDFSYANMVGSVSENVVIDTGKGTARMNNLSNAGTITSLVVNAGEITFSGPIAASHIDMVSLTTIANNSPSYLIQTPDTIYLNGLGGDIGTLDSPIFIQSGGQIFVGAGGSLGSLAVIIGSSSDNTVHPIPSNPPCKIIFNGVVIKDCGFVPPLGPGITVFQTLPFAVPGFDSSYFNLADDYFFLPFFLDKRYVEKKILLYYSMKRPRPMKSWLFPSF